QFFQNPVKCFPVYNKAHSSLLTAGSNRASVMPSSHDNSMTTTARLFLQRKSKTDRAVSNE
ncbi:MAG: hypothetical protein LBH50_04325, partial [Spirochaetaceae bacterium]|nr:hypothetical protein [Spirochaetaceae bacterium]